MLKFDTRDKKPKLWDLIPLAFIYVLILAVLVFKRVSAAALPACITSIVFFTLVLIRLIISFFGQIHYNPYSYNTIYYFAFALFDLFVIIEHFFLLKGILNFPDVYSGVEVFHTLLGSASTFMYLTSPFLFLFSIAMCISNISLLKHEGKRFVNVLGIILSVLVVGGVAAMFAYDYYASGSQFQVMMHDLFGNLFAALYLYYEFMLLGVIVADAIAAAHEPLYNKDFVIILGCNMQKDGRPTPLLRGRIDRAIEFSKKQFEAAGKELVFICSGGQGENEPISESRCMKNYLLEQGIPEDRIIEEDKSKNTFENMKFSKEKILEINPDAKVAFSTTNYHVFRSGLYARRNKMRAVGMGAKTKWYFWPNAAVREFIGLLTAHKLKQAIIIIGLVVFYIGLTILSYCEI